MITIDELKPLENIINGFESNLIEHNLHKTDIHDIKETLFNIIDLYVKDNIINMKSYKFEKEVYEYMNIFIEENTLFNNLINLGDYLDECVDYYFNFIQIPRHYPNYTTKNIDTLAIENRIKILRNKPQPDQRTPEWYLFRGEHLTASSAWKAFESQKTQNQLIYSKCAPIDVAKKSSVNVNSACHHGHKYEPLSTMIYEFENDTIVEEFGCLGDDHTPYLAASPDGINVKKNNKLYGRLLEIKNPKSRVISGIPKIEYWVQMQFQMHVAKLHICDFLETTFTEYENEEEYLNDGEFSLSSDNKHKGVIVCFNDSNGPLYEYSPINITKKEFNKWYDNLLKKYENISWIENIWWKVNVYSCVTVLYNKEWFDAAKPYFKKIWDTIQKEKKTGYEHRKAVKRISTKKHILSKEDEFIKQINSLANASYEKNNKKVKDIKKELPNIIRIRTQSFDETNVNNNN